MCGIIGYVGRNDASVVLMEGLKKLEYRGYDSAGVAVIENDQIKVVKSKGRLDELAKKMLQNGSMKGFCGIGHTRWATHGEPSCLNSHPHGNSNVTLVHNGIIENYLQIKDNLLNYGYRVESQTDTEVVALLLDYYYKGDPFSAIKEVMVRIRGSYALAILFKDFPDCIFALRKDSPLIIGLSEGENFVASDIPAILKYTNKFCSLEEDEIAVIQKEKAVIYDLDKNIVQKEVMTATWDIEAAEKGNFPHFMLKEIYEEPMAMKNTILSRVHDGLPFLGVKELTDERLADFQRIHIVACGTAMNAGLIGKFAIEIMARIPVDVCISSEFRYNNPILSKKDMVIIISQSGETADTLAALRLAKEQGVYTLAIVNVVGSSIASKADSTIYTWAGPEIAVASTKAYIAQISILYLLALRFGLAVNSVYENEIRELTAQLLKMPEVIHKVITELREECHHLAGLYQNAKDLFFMGRGIDYCLAMEGSLKLKEISYIHSEAYAAGELKHGAISLVTEGVPVIAIATQALLYDKMISNIKEVKARGAHVMLICRQNAENAGIVADHVLNMPDVADLFMPLPAVVVMQLFAYYVSLLRGCDVDKPRNLAKSVTVE